MPMRKRNSLIFARRLSDVDTEGSLIEGVRAKHL